MRAIATILFSGAIATSAAQAQDALTYSFDGRVGFGYLDHESKQEAGSGFLGYRYEGFVLRTQGTGRVDLALSDTLHLGAVAQVSFQRGDQGNFDRITPGGITENGGSEFGGTDLDLAVYAAVSPVTISYGKMDSAFDFATTDIRNGGSIIDGGNAVWMNIGDGSGSLGDRSEQSSGPAESPDYRTLRADVTLGEFTLAASTSRGTRSGTSVKVNAAGIVWKRELEDTTIFVGAGYDRGPNDSFNSLSFGMTHNGLNFEVSRIHRKPLVVSSGITASYDVIFLGSSVSYDLGSVTLGLAAARQETRGEQVFAGYSRALWASWEARENLNVDFELSENDYRISTGNDTRKASLAVSLDF